MGTDEWELAKRISNAVWQKYDDAYGYRSEKQESNAAVNVEVPENIWFFWNQFDSINQEEFVKRVNESQRPGAAKLKAWVNKQIIGTRNASAAFKARTGIEI